MDADVRHAPGRQSGDLVQLPAAWGSRSARRMASHHPRPRPRSTRENEKKEARKGPKSAGLDNSPDGGLRGKGGAPFLPEWVDGRLLRLICEQAPARGARAARGCGLRRDLRVGLGMGCADGRAGHNPGALAVKKPHVGNGGGWMGKTTARAMTHSTRSINQDGICGAWPRPDLGMWLERRPGIGGTLCASGGLGPLLAGRHHFPALLIQFSKQGLIKVGSSDEKSMGRWGRGLSDGAGREEVQPARRRRDAPDSLGIACWGGDEEFSGFRNGV